MIDRKVEGAIFDVDGTLLDTMSVWYDDGKRYLAKMGIEADPDLGDVLFSETSISGAQYIIDRYNLDMTVEEVAAGVLGEMEEFYNNEAQPTKGAVELLRYFCDQGIPMTIVTSTDGYCIDAAMERLGLKGYFKEIYSAADLGMTKREPKIFNMAAKKMNTKPEDTWVFEDALYAINTASDAGFKTVGIYDSVSHNDQEDIKKKADIYVKSLDELVLKR